jgi:outer membrane lipoprotein carrier protein
MTLPLIALWLVLAGENPTPPAAKPAAGAPAAKPAAGAPAAKPGPAAPAPSVKPGTPRPAAPGAALPLPQVIERMQKRYEAARDFRARFAQKYTSAATGRVREYAGELLIKKPGKMRWNYEKPEPQMYLANGQTLWVYEPEAKQVYKQDLKASQLPAAVSFLMGRGKLTDEFDISLAKELPYGGPADHRLSLKPKKPQSTYKAIYFVVDPQSFLVRQSVLVGVQGDINAMTFSDMKIDSGLQDSEFTWKRPAGVREIQGASR